MSKEQVKQYISDNSVIPRKQLVEQLRASGYPKEDIQTAILELDSASSPQFEKAFASRPTGRQLLTKAIEIYRGNWLAFTLVALIPIGIIAIGGFFSIFGIAALGVALKKPRHYDDWYDFCCSRVRVCKYFGLYRYALCGNALAKQRTS